MAIKSGVSLGVVPVLTSDTVVFDSSSITNLQRYAIEAASFHNTTLSKIDDIEIYASPDLTSASGDRVALYSISSGLSKDIIEIIGQGYDGLNII
ncbi:MAG: hypothetical protein K0U08_03370, partial [Proteobacteria bacterium]|nr:hypothetical protein [Pseudomonadota bacterium]